MLRDRALSRFGAIARALGPPSFETRLIDDEAGRGISLQARYCDLVVIGPTDANESIPVVTHDFPGYVVMNAARPVLIVPCDGRFDEIGRKPLIAWDARTAAARAVTDAIPFLKHAAMVDLAVFDPGERATVHGEQPGTDIALYLARHDIRVNVTQHTASLPIGDALVALATELGSDLIVMGGDRHARLHAILPGGVTPRHLESMAVPVLMSH